MSRAKSRVAGGALVALMAITACQTAPTSLPTVSSGKSSFFTLGAATYSRPLSDFLDNQGKDPGRFFPGTDWPALVGWLNNGATPPNPSTAADAVQRFAFIDYAGVADPYLAGHGYTGTPLGTKVTGTVTERPLPDGTAQVTVNIHTQNALTWVSQRPDPNTSARKGPLLFGSRLSNSSYGGPGVLEGGKPALATSNFTAVFRTVGPHLPLPDITDNNNNLTPPQTNLVSLDSISIQANATGELRAAFGVPDGTAGKASVKQRDVANAQGRSETVADDFPVEFISLTAAGK